MFLGVGGWCGCAGVWFPCGCWIAGGAVGMVRAGAVPLMLDGDGLIAWLWWWGCSPGSLIAGAGGWLMVWLPGSGWIAWLLSWCGSRVVGCCYPALSRFPSVAVGYCSLPSRWFPWMLPRWWGDPGVIPRGLVGACSFSLSRRMVRCSRGGCWLAGALLRVVDGGGCPPDCWIARGCCSPVGGLLLTRLTVVLFDSPVAVPRGWLLLVR